jgi:hypothetical protein
MGSKPRTDKPAPTEAEKPSAAPAKPKSEFDEHFLVTLPGSFPKKSRWGVEWYVLFRDGVGVLNMDAIREHKPGWFKVDAGGKQVKAAIFSIYNYVKAFEKMGAKVKRIPADEAKKLRYEIGADQETRLRAQGFHEQADKLTGKKIAEQQAANEAEARAEAETKAAKEVHKDDPSVHVPEPEKAAEKAPHEEVED